MLRIMNAVTQTFERTRFCP